jgi:ribosomal protein S12 methylthiotransferase accessory factor
MKEDIINQLVNSRYGIAQYLHESVPEPNCPNIFVYNTKMANTSVFLPERCNEYNSGAGLSRQEAITSAVGETIERYCSGAWETSDLIFGTYNELKQKYMVLSPDKYQFFNKNQEKALQEYAVFERDTLLNWVLVHSLTYKKPVLVPASAIFLPFKAPLKKQGEQIVYASYSTGLACGSQWQESLYHGLCECVERDAFMNLWLNRLPLPRVDINSDLVLKKVFKRFFEKEQLEYIIINATTDIHLTSINCFLIDHAYSPPLVAVGGCASLSSRKAIFKAILEAAHAYLWARTLRQDEREYKKDFSDILDFDDHVSIHASGQLFHSLDFIFDVKDTHHIDTLPNFDFSSYTTAVNYVVELLKQAGHDVYAADLTTTDIRSLGLSVTRAFVPGLIQLNAGIHRRQLGNRRLFSLPKKMGFTTHETTIDSLNPFPHPYP